MNLEPLFNSLSTQILPACRSMIFLQIAKPMPAALWFSQRLILCLEKFIKDQLV